MQHYGVNGYSLHAMNSLSAMYNLHQQAAQQAQHAPDYRPSVHALTLAERLAGKGLGTWPWGQDTEGWLFYGLLKTKVGGTCKQLILGGLESSWSLSDIGDKSKSMLCWL